MASNRLLSRRLFHALLILTLCAGANFLRAAVAGDEHWDNQFGSVGPNGILQAIAAEGNNIYVGGSFTAAGNTKASAVARFDGTNWFPLNAGLLGTAIVVGMWSDGNSVYAGGVFTNADDPTGINTARWDGTNWSGTPVQGVTYVIKRNGNDLYFGGVFISAAGVANTTNIARFDGTNWFALGSGNISGNGIVSGVVCLAFEGNNVYVGGTFTNAGGVLATNVAYFDGSVWHAMGGPLTGSVTALAFFGPYLYAGGSFTNSSLQITNLARWDGSVWSAIPSGGANRGVTDIVSSGTNLFICGGFTQIGGIISTSLVSFDGSTWSTIAGGTPRGLIGSIGQVNKMLWYSNQLYIVGSFERVGNTGAANVARWDGTNWSSLGGETSMGIAFGANSAQSLLPIHGSGTLPDGLYTGGIFPEAGDAIVNSVGRWDGTNWNPVGGGVSGTFTGSAAASVRTLATDGTHLFAAGSFTNAGGNSASGIASWDGSNWSPLGGGVDYIVNTMAYDSKNGFLFVGGTFTNADGSPSKGVAEWLPGWISFGGVDGGSGAVNSIVFDQVSKMYIGGSFTTVNGIAATNVAYFDYNDFNWHSMGLGFNAKINTLAYGNGTLYAGGSFTSSGALTVNHIAQWDGSAWSSLGSGITGGSSIIVNYILVTGPNVYATGNFTNCGGVFATNIARWDGASWHAMGSGLDIARAGFALATNDNDLFVVGNFSLAGDKPAQFISHWNDQSNYYAPANMRLTRTAWQTNRQFKARLTGTSGQSYVIQGSTNLTTWTPLVTNSVMFFDFVDTNAPNIPSRYYRAVLGP